MARTIALKITTTADREEVTRGQETTVVEGGEASEGRGVVAGAYINTICNILSTWHFPQYLVLLLCILCQEEYFVHKKNFGPFCGPFLGIIVKVWHKNHVFLIIYEKSGLENQIWSHGKQSFFHDT